MLNDLTSYELGKLHSFIGYKFNGQIYRAFKVLFPGREEYNEFAMQDLRAFCSSKIMMLEPYAGPKQKVEFKTHVDEIISELPEWMINKDYRSFLNGIEILPHDDIFHAL